MASFFKRFVTGALDRREERRELNILVQEKEIQSQLKKIENAELSRREDQKVLKNRKQTFAPIKAGVALDSNLDPSTVSDAAVAIALQNTNKDPQKARMLLSAQVKTNPEFFNMAGKDAQTGLEAISSQVSTTSQQLPATQRAQTIGRQTDQALRGGEAQSSVSSRFASSVLGSILGEAPGSAREKVRERYASLFETDEQAAESYDQVVSYIERSNREGDITSIPPMNPEMAAQLIQRSGFIRNKEIFTQKVEPELKKQLATTFSMMKARALQIAYGASPPENRDSIPATNLIETLRQAVKGSTKENQKLKVAASIKSLQAYETVRVKILERAKLLYDSGMTSTPTASDAVSKAKKQIMEGLDKHDKRPTSDGKEVESVAQQDVLDQARKAETAAYAQADEATTKVSPQSNSDATEVMNDLRKNYKLEIETLSEEPKGIKKALDNLAEKYELFIREGDKRYSYENEGGKRVVFEYTGGRGPENGDGAAPYVIRIIK